MFCCTRYDLLSLKASIILILNLYWIYYAVLILFNNIQFTNGLVLILII